MSRDMGDKNVGGTADFITSSRDFFQEMVEEACQERQVQTIPEATNYLIDVLVFYMNTDNLYDEESSGRKTRETLAEMMLRAGNAQRKVRFELLKKLGDTALYVSGFFGESLQRKIVDADYYKDMGETAYGHLAAAATEGTSVRVYSEFSQRFTMFADILSYISSKTVRPASSNLLSLFERYVTTGSDLARDQILEEGLITVPVQKKIYNQ